MRMINQARMYDAGKICEQLQYTDEELRLAVLGTKMVLAYLRGRGDYYKIIHNLVRQDLDILEKYFESRGMK